MAATINKNIARGLNTMGYWVSTLFSIVCDNSYPTGGYSFVANQIKLGAIEYMAPIILANAAGTLALVAQYNYVTNKLQVFQVAGATGQAAKLSVTGGQAPGIALQTDVDSNSGVLGKTTAGNISITATLSAAGGAKLVEVDNATDLSLFSGRGVAWGKG